MTTKLSGTVEDPSIDTSVAIIKPDFFIVGAAKAGTTALYNYLKLHSDIYFSPIKEPHFFSTDIEVAEMRDDFKKNALTDIGEYLRNSLGSPRHGAFVRDESHYHQLFSLANGEKRIGESSVSYLYSKVAAKNIRAFNEDAKIIIILREPIERAFSHYLMDLRIGYEQTSFKDAVISDINKVKKGWGQTHLYIELGQYYEQVKRFMDIYEPTNIKILLHDDFKKSPQKVLKDVFCFLEIADKTAEIDFLERHNKAELPKSRILQRFEKLPMVQKILANYIPGNLRRKLKRGFYSTDNLPKLTEADRTSLKHYFSEDIQRLSKLINRDLSHWLDDSNLKS